MKKVPVIVVKFTNEIQQKDISAFRTALLNELILKGCKLNNYAKKISDSPYAYPFIQFKRIKNKAVLFAIAKGTENILNFLTAFDFECFFRENKEKIILESVKEDEYIIRTSEYFYSYSIRRYLPFNIDSKERYDKIISQANQKLYIERQLLTNIKNFAKSIDVELDDKITVAIDSITDTGVKFYKRMPYDSFDISFKANISIPNYTGLGKIISHGFGSVVRIDSKKTES
ncbi:MAG: hypothetical protein LBC89_03430 [Bacteroidales bacterium]|jgi:hypothetical protein|nr:hypothetical protein [Bacteroidales bacterium]